MTRSESRDVSHGESRSRPGASRGREPGPEHTGSHGHWNLRLSRAAAAACHSSRRGRGTLAASAVGVHRDRHGDWPGRQVTVTVAQ